MNLAVIGSGGREHALCYKLKQSKSVKKLFCIPGNGGTKKIAENINIDISNFDTIYKTIKEKKIDYVIVGPEEPLVNGIVNFLIEKHIKVFGPDKFSSKLEGSKAFLKNLCKENKIPTAQFNAIQLDTCVLPASYSLVNSSIGGIINSWSLGDGSNTNSTNLNYSYINPGNYDITLTTMNQFGCSDSISNTVNHRAKLSMPQHCRIFF